VTRAGALLAAVAWLVPIATAWLVPAAAAGVEALPAPEANPAGAPPPHPTEAHRDAVPQGPSVDERLVEIARRIQRALRYPPIARERGATGEALVAFEIRSDGTPERVELARTSGSGALDRAALRAVADAAPLPFVYGRIHVPVRFALEPPR
jgi:protein TonB